MSGRREAQKELRRAAMLAAAGRLFERQGYARTTFEEIAAEAGVGVATVYKYFSSKQGLVSAILEPDLQRILLDAQKVIDRPCSDPAKSMVALLSCFCNIGGVDWASRELLRLTVFPGMDNGGLLTDFVLHADSATQAKIRELLIRQRDAGRLQARLPLEDATAVIFALLNQHFGSFLFDPAATLDQTFRRLARRVRLVFANWCR